MGILGLIFIEILGWVPLHFLYAAGVSFVLSCVSMLVFSLVAPPSGKEIADLT